MIDAIVELARVHEIETGRPVQHIFLGPGAYAALEADCERRFASEQVPFQAASADVCITLGSITIRPCEAEGMLFR